MQQAYLDLRFALGLGPTGDELDAATAPKPDAGATPKAGDP